MTLQTRTVILLNNSLLVLTIQNWLGGIVWGPQITHPAGKKVVIKKQTTTLHRLCTLAILSNRKKKTCCSHE